MGDTPLPRGDTPSQGGNLTGRAYIDIRGSAETDVQSRMQLLSAALTGGEVQCKALADVLAERRRQDAKWGEQNLDPITYLAVLTEEVGELSQAALHTRFGGDKAAGLRDEAVHAAAVALAIVECLDRGKWAWPGM